MTKTKLYRYVGLNGIITSMVLLEGIRNTPLLRLTASEGHLLTNGEIVKRVVTIEAADLDSWREITDDSV